MKPHSTTLVFDIETVGQPFENFDELTQHKLLSNPKEGETPQDHKARVVDEFGLSPYTGKIVTIACVNAQSGKGTVFYDANGATGEERTEDGHRYIACTEKTILENFWKMACLCQEFVTFNGRRFDAPYVMLRSAILGIKPSCNLLENRYLSSQRSVSHVDLYDQLNFYGAFGAKYMSLHMACQAFGITSPKEGGMDGSQVGGAFEEGRYKEIAEYCLADVIATTELYTRWDELLRF